MQLDAADDKSDRAGPLQRLDARLKLVFSLILVVGVVAAPVGWWRLLGVIGLVLAFLIGLSGANARTLLARWTGFLALVGFLAAVVAPGLAARSGSGIAEMFLGI